MHQNTPKHDHSTALEKLYLPTPTAPAREPLRGRIGWLNRAIARAPAGALTASRSTKFATFSPPPPLPTSSTTLANPYYTATFYPITLHPPTLHHCSLSSSSSILTPICPIGMLDPLLMLVTKETVPCRPDKNLCLPFVPFSFQFLQYSIERP